MQGKRISIPQKKLKITYHYIDRLRKNVSGLFLRIFKSNDRKRLRLRELRRARFYHGPKFRLSLICPAWNLVGECLPQTLLRPHGLHIPRFATSGKAHSFRRSSSPHTTRFAGLVRGPHNCFRRSGQLCYFQKITKGVFAHVQNLQHTQAQSHRKNSSG